MTIGLKVGAALGWTAARVVHYGEVTVEGTGQFGKDVVQGAKQQYVGDRASLLAARAEAMRKRAEEMQRKAEPAPAPVPAAQPAVIVAA